MAERWFIGIMPDFEAERNIKPDWSVGVSAVVKSVGPTVRSGATTCGNLNLAVSHPRGGQKVLDLRHSDGCLAAHSLYPVRTIRNRGARHNLLGKFPSQKMDRMVRYESSLERDYLLWLEFDPAVIGMVEQPFKVKYKYEGKNRCYTPDFLVNHKTGYSSIIEVKPSDKLACKKLQLKLKLVADIIEDFGYNFKVVTEKHIRREPQLRNICLLQRYSRTSVSDHQYFACRALLQEQSHLTIADLCHKLYASGLTIAGIYSLIYKGALWTGLNVKITDQSIVCLTRPSKSPVPNIN